MVRVYGMTIGHGSYARVTRGVTAALRELGLLSGVVALDAMDDWDSPSDGVDAPVAVVIAPQTRQAAVIASRSGVHARRAMLLPLNSSFCPDEMLALASPTKGAPNGQPMITDWLTPSRWSAEQLRPLTRAPVTVWRHGVAPEFCPKDDLLQLLRESRADGQFRVLHMTSTPRQRKGTAQLIQAWSRLLTSGKLPSKSLLSLVLSSAGIGGEIEARLALLEPDVAKTVEVVRTPLDLPVPETARLYQSYHAIAQPSRGEGFGMVPLEALSCGVPVVATACSGHSEFLSPQTPGLALVEHGALGKIDDGPGAVAPTVSVDAVADALVRCHDGWQLLAEEARDNADNLRRDWSWTNVMRQWAVKEGWIRT